MLSLDHYRQTLLPRLRWSLMRGQQALGVWGLLAIGSMVVALLLELTLIGPAAGQDALRRQELTTAIAEQPQQVQVTEPSVIEQLPTAEAFAARVEQLLSRLGQHGFSVEQTTLTYTSTVEAQLQRLELDIPLSGSYPALRRALADVAREPGVRIENLSLERKDIHTDLLTIGLKLSLLGALP